MQCTPLTFIHLSYLLSIAISHSLWGAGWITHVWYWGGSLSYTHKHTGAGVSLCMCYGCVSMLCRCVQGCYGLNGDFCLLPWKHTHTVIPYTQKGKSPVEKKGIRNTQAYMGLRTHTHLQHSSPGVKENEHTCISMPRVRKHAAMYNMNVKSSSFGLQRPPHPHQHCQPYYPTYCSWSPSATRWVIEERDEMGEHNPDRVPKAPVHTTGLQGPLSSSTTSLPLLSSVSYIIFVCLIQLPHFI